MTFQPADALSFLPKPSPGTILLREDTSGGWLCFENPTKIFITHQTNEVLPILEEIENLTRNGKFYTAGFISYEAAPAFDPALVTHEPDGFPLLWFGIYEKPTPYQLPKVNPSENPLFTHWSNTVTPTEYTKTIEIIKELIRSGETYQTNYTYRLRFNCPPSLFESFLVLNQVHQPPYAAWLDTGKWCIASLSPELFFSINNNEITCRPMKGTRARGLTFEADQAMGESLLASEKDRAENIMIVDMVRNDLGRIAELGSIKVRNLFTLEQYPSVWQMTSTVVAQAQASFTAILQALFPCASITGAPKIKTMKIISALETTPRHLYTGSIGYLGPGNKAQFNVAIRTLVVEESTKKGEYGVGGGILIDSNPVAEWEECQIKASNLGMVHPDFDLLETLLWTLESGYQLLSLHLKRMGQSARYFGFHFDGKKLEKQLHEKSREFPQHPQKVRMLLSRTGNILIESIEYIASSNPVLCLRLARKPIDPTNRFLYHKTTNRTVYTNALNSIPGAEDVLLYNPAGEITESTIANVFIIEEDKAYTPPVRCGLLPGTFRESMLQSGQIHEQVLTIDQVLASKEVYLMNSVRGIYRIHLHE